MLARSESKSDEPPKRDIVRKTCAIPEAQRPAGNPSICPKPTARAGAADFYYGGSLERFEPGARGTRDGHSRVTPAFRSPEEWPDKHGDFLPACVCLQAACPLRKNSFRRELRTGILAGTQHR